MLNMCSKRQINHLKFSMVVPNQILVVVSILEGRRFPRRPKHKLIVEAKFDGETLSTDPVEHGESPHFTTELAWELDKKALHQHKLQRTPIKLQCFAIDTSFSQKELVGYIILDLRSAQPQQQRLQWFPLLNSKYQRLKPEVQLCLSLEDDAAKGKKDNYITPHHSTPSRPENNEATNVEPILNEEKGYYQLGPVTPENQIFLLSLTIGYAVNLAQLIPSSFVVPDGQGFYFQYTLFGNNVSSDIFTDLLQPRFSPERASVRIFTKQQILRIYLENFPGIKITLYCGGHPLGSAVISLQSLLTNDEEMTSPAAQEALFPLASSGGQSEKSVQSSLVPAVSVSVVLKNENMMAATLPSTSQATQPGVEKAEPTRDSEGLGKPNIENPIPEKKQHMQYQDDMRMSGDKKTSPEMVPTKDSTEEVSRNTLHHFCYSIDLRSIQDLQVTSSVNCFLKYSYPFFGSAAPVITSPPIEVRRHMQVLLPKSFCAFDFATNPSVLRDTLSRVPLVVEVWHRDPLTKDVLLGLASITLGHVFAAKKLKAMKGKSSTYGQILSERIHIIADDGKPIGELHAVLGLEDLGPVAQELLEAHKNEAESFSSSVESSQQGVPAKPENDDPRKMAEYQTALELEMWKQQQEELFTTQLKTKETEHMKTLAEEWKKRDREREVLTKKKVEEYRELEEKLKRSIIELEKKEKQLVAAETELLRMKDEQKREHDRKMVELREASRRMKEDCEHSVELERAKVRNIEEEKQRILQQLGEAQNRFQEKEMELLAYKEQQMTKPEMKLEAELSLLKVEKVELERKLESANKSKIHYKQQWGKALRELGKVKQNEQSAAWARLKQQEKELEQLRLRFIAAEEKEIANTEKEELQKIKTELSRLKEQERSKREETVSVQQQQHSQENRERATMLAAREREEMQRQEEADSRIAKLIEERDTLLQTGVYTTDDRIISELDRQIREAIAAKG